MKDQCATCYGLTQTTGVDGASAREGRGIHSDRTSLRLSVSLTSPPVKEVWS